MPETLDDINRENYRAEISVRSYAERSGLQPAETAILCRLGGGLRESRALDIGVGGGRTTPYLSRASREYIGVDYSPELVEAARRRFPDQRFENADVRDLGMFDDDEFDFVLFSFNGLDYIDHEGRLAGLAEIRRVLRQGGTFVFSSHNRSHRTFDKLPWQRPHRPGPEMLRRSKVAWQARARRLEMRPRELRTPEYAIVNDDAHGYRLLTYYISPHEQIEQLRRAQFSEVVIHDGAGVEGVLDHNSVWIYYLAR